MADLKCDACGRSQSDATFVIQRGSLTRWIYYTCSCGREWTVPEVAEDLAAPVTSDEVIAVHEALEANPTMGEITR